MSDGPNESPKSTDFRASGGRPTIVQALSGPLAPEDLITLNEEIAAMAKAGLPLDQGLSALAKEMGGGRLQAVTERLANDLRAGCTLPEAIQRQSASLPPYYAALLNAGIRSNRLGEVLGTMTLYARQMADFREAITSALFYPAVVMVLGFGLVAFVSYLIVPKYAEMFAAFNMRLPILTEILFYIGTRPIEFFVLPPVVLVVGLVLERWWLRSSASGRVLWARFVNAVPIAGTMIRSARLAAFADLLGILVDQSVPLPECLPLAAEASGDALLIAGIKKIGAELNEGVPLGEALHRQRLVPDLLVWMISFGERQGTLGPTLHQLSLLYRRQAEVRAAFLRTVLPPILIVLLALTLGGLFIFGLMGPFLELLDGLSGGGKK